MNRKQYARRWRLYASRDWAMQSLDHVTHFNLGGQGRFLCGKLYDPASMNLRGTDRPALNSGLVSCNRCQRAHTALMATQAGRAKLGLTV